MRLSINLLRTTRVSHVDLETLTSGPVGGVGGVRTSAGVNSVQVLGNGGINSKVGQVKSSTGFISGNDIPGDLLLAVGLPSVTIGGRVNRHSESRSNQSQKGNFEQHCRYRKREICCVTNKKKE